MSAFLYDLNQALAIIAILLGLISCFFGYKCFRLFLAMTGFVLFLSFGVVLTYYFITPNIIAASVVGSTLALVGGLVVSFMPGFGAFMIGNVLGGVMSVILLAFSSSDYLDQDDTRDIVIFSFALFFGCMAIYYKRAAILTGTSVIGAFAVTYGIDHFVDCGFSDVLPKIANAEAYTISFNVPFIILAATFCLLAALGGLIQYRLTGNVYTDKDVVNTETPAALRISSYVKVMPCYKRPIDEVPLLDVTVVDD